MPGPDETKLKELLFIDRILTVAAGAVFFLTVIIFFKALGSAAVEVKKASLRRSRAKL